MQSLALFYLGGALATALCAWAEAPVMRSVQLPVPRQKLAVLFLVLVLAWPFALVAVRVHWERNC